MMRVAVLHSDIAEGRSKDEDDVLIQAKVVCCALSKLGYEPSPVPFTSDVGAMIERLRAFDPAFVFNLVETVESTGRFIHFAPAVLDQLGICYTGATTDAVFLTSNKILAKRLFAGSTVPTPLWHTKQDLQNGCPVMPGTYLIKSVWEHGSVGLDDASKVSVSSPTDLLGALRTRARQLGGECFAEAFIEGREFNLSLLEVEKAPHVLPPAEILFHEYPAEKAKIVGYRAKWEADSFEYTHTPRCFEFSEEDASLLDELRRMALSCWDLFALRGYARVDFRVDAANRPWVLEVNTNPCLSPDAGFVAAAERSGLTFEQVVEKVVAASQPAGNDHVPTHNRRG